MKTYPYVIGVLSFVVLLLAFTQTSNAAPVEECPSFTYEQRYLLRMAKVIGDQEELGFTLAGLIWRESFVGDHIVRINESDGKYGSYGVAHMQLATAMYLLEITNVWEAKAELMPRLINDDVYALTLSLGYLVRHRERGWRGMIARYNGSGEAARLYSEDVIRRATILQRCMITG